MDNNFGTVDIFGSWVEIGMVFLAIGAGVVFGIPALFHLAKKFSAKKQKPVSRKFITRHSRINEYLTELRVKLDGARTNIIQFHNGGQIINGESMQKMSVTHESCVDGIKETHGDRQDVLLSMWSDFLEKLSQEDAKPILTSTLNPSHFKRVLEANTVLMFSTLPLRGLKGNLLGAVVVEWCNWSKVDEIDFVVVKEELIDKRRYIEAQLSETG
jgi:hypothetical protein